MPREAGLKRPKPKRNGLDASVGVAASLRLVWTICRAQLLKCNKTLYRAAFQTRAYFREF
jgi:hypothetical protein